MLDMFIIFNIRFITAFDLIDVSDKLHNLLLTNVASLRARFHPLYLPQLHPLLQLCGPGTPLTRLLFLHYAPSDCLWLGSVPLGHQLNRRSQRVSCRYLVAHLELYRLLVCQSHLTVIIMIHDGPLLTLLFPLRWRQISIEKVLTSQNTLQFRLSIHDKKFLLLLWWVLMLLSAWRITTFVTRVQEIWLLIWKSWGI